MAWGTLIYIFDLTLGEPSIIYLLVATLLAGLFVYEPIFFTITSLASIITVLIFFFIHQERFFNGELLWENGGFYLPKISNKLFIRPVYDKMDYLFEGCTCQIAYLFGVVTNYCLSFLFTSSYFITNYHGLAIHQ